MLFDIREFARERLAELEIAASVAEKHAEFYRDMAEAAAPGMTGPDQKRLLDGLDRENGNLRAAITWSIESGAAETALRLGYALWRFWQMRGLLVEGAGWLERILAVPEASAHPQARARALEAAGGVAYWRARMREAIEYYEACLELCRQTGDKQAIANALYNIGFPSTVNGVDVPRALATLEESLALYRELGDEKMIARVMWGLGNANYFAKDYGKAREILLEDVAMLRRFDDPFSLSWALHTLGLAYHRLGQTVPYSAPLWREALEHFATVGDVSGITILLGDFSLLASAEGDDLRAVILDAASLRIAEVGGILLGAVVGREEEGRPEIVMFDAAAARAATQAAIERGRAMTVEEAVAYALAGLPATSQPFPPSASPSPANAR